jgi:hypothetical protein
MPLRDQAEHIEVQIRPVTDPNHAQRAAWRRLWALLLADQAAPGHSVPTNLKNRDAALAGPAKGVEH